jgi:exodeoxyribonuclease X
MQTPIHIRDAKYLVVDVETTGRDAEVDKIIQIGAVWVDWEGNVLDTFEDLVNPEGTPIPPDASAVHHLVDEDVAEAPPIAKVLTAMYATRPFDVLVAHNAPFDMAFLKPDPKTPVIDTLRLAQHLWPELDQHKNQYLRYYWKLKVHGGGKQMTHSALPDALVTAANLAHELKAVMALSKDPDNLTVDKIIPWILRPVRITKFRFGKHRGKLILDMAREDPSYLKWMLNKMEDLDEDLRSSVLWALEEAQR